MNFLKRIWRKMFGVKTGIYSPVHIDREELKRTSSDSPVEIKRKVEAMLYGRRPAYDPSADENKILMGEVESYFD